jgi:uncharacterized protein YndB with AHSA1/START domain
MTRYAFVDEWLLPGPPDDVYGVLSCPRDYPSWWPDAFLEGEGDDGPAAPGKRARLLTRGKLPYRLRWELVCVEATPGRRLVSQIQGDFEGIGTWTIEPRESGSLVRLEWIVEVRKPVVRYLTPVLRPLFAWNHRWAMNRGRERISALLSSATAVGAASGSA